MNTQTNLQLSQFTKNLLHKLGSQRKNNMD